MSRDNDIKIRLSADEYAAIKTKTEQNPEYKSMSDLCRKKVLAEEYTKRNQRKDLRDLTFQIRKISVNINQAAHRINGGYILPSDQDMLLQKMEEIEKYLKDIQDLMGRGG